VSAHIAAGERISVSGHLFMLIRGTQKLEVVSLPGHTVGVMLHGLHFLCLE
jgi:hypothetical protein